jgi:3-deoxy-D-manno-octulosonic-acid transferase
MIFWIFIYRLSLKLYTFGFYGFSFINDKAKQGWKGREFQEKSPWIYRGNAPLIWFHCASVGEFEQGKPLIEKWKQQHPDDYILVTFFSASGFVAKSNDPIIDKALYLPIDHPTKSNAFIEQIKPTKVFFIKYEFWYFYFKSLTIKKIPLYIISAHFRENQVFFKPFIGRFFRQMLHYTNHIFVQTTKDQSLLNTVGINHVSVSGDTRLERVVQIKNETFSDSYIATFCGSHTILVAGSTWPEDETHLKNLIHKNKNLKYIIVPHEISAKKTQEWLQQHPNELVVYSTIKKDDDLSLKRILYIDQMGLLSKIYRYATIAYVGGGFGKGIHNILEAAVYEIPVIFGPNFQRFAEAVLLKQQNIAFSINDSDELIQLVHRLVGDKEELQNRKEKTKNYFELQKNASETILQTIQTK